MLACILLYMVSIYIPFCKKKTMYFVKTDRAGVFSHKTNLKIRRPMRKSGFLMFKTLDYYTKNNL